MKIKQFESIKRQHIGYMNAGEIEKPSLEKHVKLAIVSGETPRLKSVKELAQLAREKIVSDRYGSGGFAMHEVFVSCNGYEGEMREFKAKEKERENRVKAYLKRAEPLMRKAELDDTADAESISAELKGIAEANGLTP